MSIPESQLNIWSKQGSITQSASTYEMIKNALQDVRSPYASRDYSISLQGSYGNDTNVYRDSDVDIVMRLNERFLYDLSNLDEPSKARFQSAYPGVEYGYYDFKRDVTAWLTAVYGSAVSVGSDAC